MTSPVSTLELDRVETRRTIRPFLLFSCAHFLIDLYSIALAVLLPLLLAHFGLSLTQAGILGGVLVLSASMAQPIYGYLSDRFHTYLFTALAPAVIAIFVCSLGLATGYWTLLAMVLLGGAGSASFHPQATAHAIDGISENRGRAMAAFITAGTLGLAFGPAYFSWITGTLGLQRTYWAALPGIVMTVLLLAFLRLPPPPPGPKLRLDLAPLRAVWRPLTILFLLVVIRSIVQITFAQFLPLYFRLQRGYSLANASYITSFYLLAGALGGFMGGNLADRFGGRRIIMFSMICSTPFLLLFVFTTGPASIFGLILGGSILLFTIPVNVMMGQELAPKHGGTVSALMMGAAWGTAGIVFIPLTGWVSDHYSMQHAFAGLVLTPIAGFLLALKLPQMKAVCLLSGGLDSATCLALARREGFECHALSFDYGQRHRIELECAGRVAVSLGASERRVIRFDLRQFGGSALTSDVAVPKGRSAEEMSESIPVTYVPARNTIFLSFALAWAEILEASDIFIGVNALDYSGYPDCRPEYIAAFERMANLATKTAVEGRTRIKVHTPLIRLSKAEIVKLAAELGLDFTLTHSCYDPDPAGRPCGACDSCLLRRKGFEEAGLTDPLLA